MIGLVAYYRLYQYQEGVTSFLFAVLGAGGWSHLKCQILRSVDLGTFPKKAINGKEGKSFNVQNLNPVLPRR